MYWGCIVAYDFRVGVVLPLSRCISVRFSPCFCFQRNHRTYCHHTTNHFEVCDRSDGVCLRWNSLWISQLLRISRASVCADNDRNSLGCPSCLTPVFHERIEIVKTSMERVSS
eukprot:PhF_6_TR27903/c0_g1_i1/m.40926